MSYDMEFNCELEEAHDIRGGTYAMNGTNDAWLNITYNYAPYFYKLWPENGIRELYGKTAEEVITELDFVIPTLSGEPDEKYWAATEGNAKAALESLRSLAKLCPPNAILDGD